MHVKNELLVQNEVVCAYVFLERGQDEGLQLTQTLIDARTSPLFHDWFGRLERRKKHTGEN